MLYSPAHGDVAQLGEHRLCKPGVEGSSPFVSTSEYAGQGPIGLLTCSLWADANQGVEAESGGVVARGDRSYRLRLPDSTTRIQLATTRGS